MESSDCDASWGVPIRTNHGRMTGLSITANVMTFYHYNAEFHVDQIDFNTVGN